MSSENASTNASKLQEFEDVVLMTKTTTFCAEVTHTITDLNQVLQILLYYRRSLLRGLYTSDDLFEWFSQQLINHTSTPILSSSDNNTKSNTFPSPLHDIIHYTTLATTYTTRLLRVIEQTVVIPSECRNIMNHVTSLISSTNTTSPFQHDLTTPAQANQQQPMIDALLTQLSWCMSSTYRTLDQIVKRVMQHESSSANLYAIINAFDELCYQSELDDEQTNESNINTSLCDDGNHNTEKALFISSWYTNLCGLVKNVKTLVSFISDGIQAKNLLYPRSVESLTHIHDGQSGRGGAHSVGDVMSALNDVNLLYFNIKQSYTQGCSQETDTSMLLWPTSHLLSSYLWLQFLINHNNNVKNEFSTRKQEQQKEKVFVDDNNLNLNSTYTTITDTTISRNWADIGYKDLQSKYLGYDELNNSFISEKVDQSHTNNHQSYDNNKQQSNSNNHLQLQPSPLFWHSDPYLVNNITNTTTFQQIQGYLKDNANNIGTNSPNSSLFYTKQESTELLQNDNNLVTSDKEQGKQQQQDSDDGDDDDSELNFLEMGCGAASLPTIITIFAQAQILLDSTNTNCIDINKKQQQQQKLVNIDFSDMNDTILNTSYDNIVNIVSRYISTPSLSSSASSCDEDGSMRVNDCDVNTHQRAEGCVEEENDKFKLTLFTKPKEQTTQEEHKQDKEQQYNNVDKYDEYELICIKGSVDINEERTNNINTTTTNTNLPTNTNTTTTQLHNDQNPIDSNTNRIVVTGKVLNWLDCIDFSLIQKIFLPFFSTSNSLSSSSSSSTPSYETTQTTTHTTTPILLSRDCALEDSIMNTNDVGNNDHNDAIILPLTTTTTSSSQSTSTILENSNTISNNNNKLQIYANFRYFFNHYFLSHIISKTNILYSTVHVPLTTRLSASQYHFPFLKEEEGEEQDSTQEKRQQLQHYYHYPPQQQQQQQQQHPLLNYLANHPSSRYLRKFGGGCGDGGNSNNKNNTTSTTSSSLINDGMIELFNVSLSALQSCYNAYHCEKQQQEEEHTNIDDNSIYNLNDKNNNNNNNKQNKKKKYNVIYCSDIIYDAFHIIAIPLVLHQLSYYNHNLYNQQNQEKEEKNKNKNKDKSKRNSRFTKIFVSIGDPIRIEGQQYAIMLFCSLMYLLGFICVEVIAPNYDTPLKNTTTTNNNNNNNNNNNSDNSKATQNNNNNKDDNELSDEDYDILQCTLNADDNVKITEHTFIFIR